MSHDNEKFTGERVIWFNPSDHLKEFRQCANYYMEAMEHARGKTVVDAGCGTGFGSMLLSLVAPVVHGVDRSIPEALLDAEQDDERPFPTGDVKFHVMDLEKEPLDITADLCVAIEFIEHLENPEYFLANVKANELFFTIPCYGDKNPYHKIQYDEGKCADLIRAHFPNLTYRMESRRMIGHAFRNNPLP